MAEATEKHFAGRGPQHLHRRRRTKFTKAETLSRKQHASMQARAGKVQITLPPVPWKES